MPKIVHLVFKTHLDIGFTDSARNVVDKYFKVFIPKAIQVSRQLRDRGGEEQFIWTTGSWLIHSVPGKGERKIPAVNGKGHCGW